DHLESANIPRPKKGSDAPHKKGPRQHACKTKKARHDGAVPDLVAAASFLRFLDSLKFINSYHCRNSSLQLLDRSFVAFNQLSIPTIKLSERVCNCQSTDRQNTAQKR